MQPFRAALDLLDMQEFKMASSSIPEMELELASDEGGGRERREENWCNRWVGKHFGMGTAKERRRGEGRKTEKNLQVIEKEMGKGGRMEMEGTFVSRE